LRAATFLTGLRAAMDLVAGFFAAVTFLAGLRFELVALRVAWLAIV
jgi:hypothetical protein